MNERVKRLAAFFISCYIWYIVGTQIFVEGVLRVFIA